MDADVLIIGAGVFGLSIARRLKKVGRDVRVVDAVGAGAGASGTPLGVLAPHSPDRWNEKKQAQFEALTSLSEVADGLREETGIDIGYRQCGRLIPLTREHHPQMWRGRANNAVTNWQGQAELSIVIPDPAWLAEEAAPFGAALCGLTARIDARAYCAALAASGRTIEREAHHPRNRSRCVSIAAGGARRHPRREGRKGPSGLAAPSRRDIRR